ncbi:hypothetical protein [Corynebacterium caspium]|uniref:hypothetical protein n=1 Tax=Corynebacterium caspium TaxID=234828 RepID=UPI000381D232|nr:hypothetical protein [Corynebacterium caspium]WKD58572.1 hypothetical protein CCASP_00720 [Corynebacterium caspium DSM 44850]
MNQTVILVAVADPTTYPEALHIAAATGKPLVDASLDIAAARQAYRRAHAILLDAAGLKNLCSSATSSADTWQPPPRAEIFYIQAEPGPIMWDLVQESGAKEAYIIPAQAVDLLSALGNLARGLHNLPEQRAGPPLAAESMPGQGRGQRQGHGRGREQEQRQGDIAGTYFKPARIITLVGAGGGVGTSTLVATTALTALAKQAACLVVDARSRSGGLDLLLGCESSLGARWEDLSFSTLSAEATEVAGGVGGGVGGGRIELAALLAALPRVRTKSDGSLRILSYARSSTAQQVRISLAKVLEAVLDGAGTQLDLVICDARGLNSLALEAVSYSDAVVVVCAAELRCAAEATNMIAQFQAVAPAISISSILVHRLYSGIGEAEYVELTGAPVIAQLKQRSRVTKLAELGGLHNLGALPKDLRKAAQVVWANG